jgi:hypothetical protein
MRREESDGRGTIGTDVLFLASFLLTITFSILALLDLLFIVPALASFFVWLILNQLGFRRAGISARSALRQRRLVSGCPFNRRLHGFYIASLLVSMNLFFALMIVELGLNSLLAFIVWLFIGSQVTQELSVTHGRRRAGRDIKG